MLEGSKHSTRCISAQGPYSFDFKTKDPLKSLGAIPYLKPVSSSELAGDLEKCLELICSPAGEEFEVDLSLPVNRLCTIASNYKLQILPENTDYSKLLSFESDSLHDSTELPMDTPNLATGEQKDNDIYFIADMDPGYAELEKVIAADNVEPQPVLPPKPGLFNEIFRNRLLPAQSMENFFVAANRMRLTPPSEGTMKCRLLTADDIKDIFEEKQLKLPTAPSKRVSSINFAAKKKNPLNWQKLHEFSMCTSDEKMNFCQPSQNLELFGFRMDKTNEIDSSQVKYSNKLTCSNDNHAEASSADLESIENEESGSILKKCKEESTIETSDESLNDKALEICDPAVIKKTGVQIFRKPTKLFAFEKQKQWKKKGEGQIEVWRMPDSGKCYLLLWDKKSEELLVHMPVDGKWNVNYLTKSTNSCHWLYDNFANCPQGIRQPLACSFTESDVASQFVTIMANCLGKPL
ncbi:uncharacterized protein LOC6583321 [Drosophila mojavensis]|uniref:RanBD1 domain-containing protein n=1 Tax=Drosophila mojavensis TaxID=7230 RepID=B4KVJ6_DROMO|nr:uncharacterized protein LOC6583321 [Drosophila mojavensis]EDW19467.2 uncharacterized protein Dmoj_GI11506 [Drosophila mojavensis]